MSALGYHCELRPAWLIVDYDEAMTRFTPQRAGKVKQTQRQDRPNHSQVQVQVQVQVERWMTLCPVRAVGTTWLGVKLSGDGFGWFGWFGLID